MEHDDAWRTLALIGLILVACIVGVSAAALTLRSLKPKAVAVVEAPPDLTETEYALALLERVRQMSEDEAIIADATVELAASDWSAVEHAVQWQAVMRLGVSRRIAGLRGTQP
jgi:hypothetical protein